MDSELISTTTTTTIKDSELMNHHHHHHHHHHLVVISIDEICTLVCSLQTEMSETVNDNLIDEMI